MYVQAEDYVSGNPPMTSSGHVTETWPMSAKHDQRVEMTHHADQLTFFATRELTMPAGHIDDHAAALDNPLVTGAALIGREHWKTNHRPTLR